MKLTVLSVVKVVESILLILYINMRSFLYRTPNRL